MYESSKINIILEFGKLKPLKFREVGGPVIFFFSYEKIETSFVVHPFLDKFIFLRLNYNRLLLLPVRKKHFQVKFLCLFRWGISKILLNLSYFVGRGDNLVSF